MKMIKIETLFVILAFSLICLGSGFCYANGEVIYRAKHTAFGELISESGPLAGQVDYTYTGQERDAPLAMLDYGARFYYPRLGRFSSIDPIDHHGESPYAYVNNNPLRYVDPTGGQGIESGFLMSMGNFVHNLGETAQSALRGWAQVTFANVPQLHLQPNPQDIQNYHMVATVGLLTAAVLTAVEYEVRASDPTGSLSGSASTAGNVKIKASSPYGSARLVVNPNGVSVKGSLKGKVGPFHDSVDTAGNGSVGVDLGKNSIGVKINKGKLSSVEVNVGKTSVELGKEDISLVVQGTGVSMERSGKTTLSFDALGLGLSATVDPQRTKGLVNGAVDHMNQAFQMNQMDQQGPVNKK